MTRILRNWVFNIVRHKFVAFNDFVADESVREQCLLRANGRVHVIVGRGYDEKETSPAEYLATHPDVVQKKGDLTEAGKIDVTDEMAYGHGGIATKDTYRNEEGV